MREKILRDINNAIERYNHLEHYQTILPQNIMENAANSFNESIPNSVNNIINLLNSVSGYERFNKIRSIRDAKALFEEEKEELDKAFELVLENKNIIGFAGGENFSAEQMLNDIYFWFYSHCDIINIILTAGKITEESRKM